MKLTDKQIAFVNEYMKDSNATAAAIKAGYSEKRASEQGYQLLQNPPVLELIRERQREVSERCIITKAEILSTVMSIMNDDATKPNDRLKASEILLRALGMNAPEKTEISGSMENKILKVKYKKDNDN